MAEVKAEPEAPQIRENALRIVLFGMPDAGKTSLLGSLAQAAEIQKDALHGELTDVTGELTELRRQVYEDEVKRTPEEIVACPVVYQPVPSADGAKQPPPLEAILFDCDGRVANEFLSRQRKLSRSDSALAQAVLGADTLVLCVDVSSRADVIKRDFQQFTRFLRLLEESRSRQSEINGLPVYLVLTKCDLLARKSDTPSSWMERIEEHKRKVHGQFQTYLAKHAEHERRPFGKVDLQVWATAVRRPPLGSSPAKPLEPYGVAELFRQCFQAAVAFRQSRKKAQRRLQWIVGAVSSLVAVMVLLAVFFLTTRGSGEAGLLENRIGALRNSYDSDSPGRLEEAARWIPRLEEIMNHSAFNELPAEMQEFVNEELAELRAYREYTSNLDQVITSYGRLRDLREEERLKELEKKLESLAPEKKVADSWGQTAPLKQRQQWLKDIHAMTGALSQLQSTFDQALKQAREWDEKRTSAAFNPVVRANQILDWAENHLPQPSDLIPGSNTITWETIYNFQSINDLEESWKKYEAQLKKYASR